MRASVKRVNLLVSTVCLLFIVLLGPATAFPFLGGLSLAYGSSTLPENVRPSFSGIGISREQKHLSPSSSRHTGPFTWSFAVGTEQEGDMDLFLADFYERRFSGFYWQPECSGHWGNVTHLSYVATGRVSVAQTLRQASVASLWCLAGCLSRRGPPTL